MRERPGWILRGFAVLFLAALAAGCTSDDEKNAPCPQARVMGEPSELTRYREGPGRDPTDVLFVARMKRVVGECDYATKGGAIDVELEVTMDVLRGPAMADGTASYRYFVALTEWTPDGGNEPIILSREAFPVDVAIPAGRQGLSYLDVLNITVPRPDQRDVRRYVIYLGFELSREELKRNSERFGY